MCVVKFTPFKHSLGEPFWSTRMEYELLGMGHSVGGFFETSITITGPFSITQKCSLIITTKLNGGASIAQASVVKRILERMTCPKIGEMGGRLAKRLRVHLYLFA